MSPESCVPKPACITHGLRPELDGGYYGMGYIIFDTTLVFAFLAEDD